MFRAEALLRDGSSIAAGVAYTWRCIDSQHTPVQGALGAISYVRGLRVLRIEDLHCRLETEAVMDLGALAQVCHPPCNMCRLHAAPAPLGLLVGFKAFKTSAVCLAQSWQPLHKYP